MCWVKDRSPRPIQNFTHFAKLDVNTVILVIHYLRWLRLLALKIFGDISSTSVTVAGHLDYSTHPPKEAGGSA